MLNGYMERYMKKFKYILINYQVVPIPPEMSLMDWYMWRSDPGNILVSKTFFLGGTIEVSTVFLPDSAWGHFETYIFGDTIDFDRRYDTYYEAWVGHLIAAVIVDCSIPKLGHKKTVSLSNTVLGDK